MKRVAFDAANPPTWDQIIDNPVHRSPRVSSKNRVTFVNSNLDSSTTVNSKESFTIKAVDNRFGPYEDAETLANELLLVQEDYKLLSPDSKADGSDELSILPEHGLRISSANGASSTASNNKASSLEDFENSIINGHTSSAKDIDSDEGHRLKSSTDFRLPHSSATPKAGYSESPSKQEKVETPFESIEISDRNSSVSSGVLNPFQSATSLNGVLPQMSYEFYQSKEYQQALVDIDKNSTALDVLEEEDETEKMKRVDAMVEEVPLSQPLALFYPPKGNWFCRTFLPGFWEPPAGYGMKINSVDSFWFSVWWFVRSKRPNFLKCTLVVAAQGVVAFYTPLVTSDIFRKYMDSDEDLIFLLEAIKLALLLYLAVTLDYYNKFWSPAGGGFQPDALSDLVKHMISLPVLVSDNLAPGFALSTMQHVRELDKSVVSLLQIMSSFVVLAATSAAFSTFSPPLIILQMLCFLITLFTVLKSSGSITKASDHFEEQSNSFMAIMEELIDRRTTIRLMGLDNYLNAKLLTATNSFRGGFKGLKMVKLRSMALLGVLDQSTAMVIIIVGGFLYRNGNLDMAELFTFFSTNQTMFAIISRMVQACRSLQINSANLKEVDKICQCRATRTNEKIKDSYGQVTFKNVCFAYDEKDQHLKDHTEAEDSSHGGSGGDIMWQSDPERKILHNAYVDIPAGFKVAVTGGSGAGKSSFMKLLSRGYQPESGDIFIDGKHLNSMDLRKTVALCEQTGLLFSMSILENIRVGTDATDAECEAAAKKACVIGMPDTPWSLPLGLATMVGPKGQQLSLGQVQRVMVARAYVRNTPVVLLDEPMSGQDGQTKASMLRNMLNLTHTRDVGESDKAVWPSTVVVITHLTEHEEKWDSIMYLERNRVSDFGKFETLIENQGPFWRFRFRSSLFVVNEAGGSTITTEGLQKALNLKQLEEAEAAVLQMHCMPRKVKAGTVIHLQGSPGDNCFFIADGVVQLFHSSKPLPQKMNSENTSFRAKKRPSVESSKPRRPSWFSFAPEASLGSRSMKNIIQEKLSFKKNSSIDLQGSEPSGSSIVSMVSEGRQLSTRTAALQATYGNLVRDLVTGDCASDNVLYAPFIGGESSGSITHQYTAIAKSECALVLLTREDFGEFMHDHSFLISKVINPVKNARTMCIDALKGSWQLADVSDHKIDCLADCMHVEVVDDADKLYSRQRSDPGFFVVIRGRLLLTMCSAVDGSECGNRVLQMGDSFGMDTLCGSEDVAGECVQTAIAVGDAAVMVLRKPLLFAYNIRTVSVTRKVRNMLTVEKIHELWPFSSLCKKDLEKVQKIMEPVVYQEGWQLINLNETTHDAYVVVHGRIDLTVKTSDNVFVSHQGGPGSFLSETKLLRIKRSPYEIVSAHCSTRSVVLRIPENALRKVSEFGVEHLNTKMWDRIIKCANAWETAEQPIHLLNHLNIQLFEANVMSAQSALNTHVMDAGADCSSLVSSTSESPLALLVIKGALQLELSSDSIFNQTTEDSVGNSNPITAKATDVFINPAGFKYLQEHRKTVGIREKDLTVLQIPESPPMCVTASERSIVALVDLTASFMCIRNSEELQESILKEQMECEALVVTGRAVQQEVALLERRLGWRSPYKGPRPTWEFVLRTVVFRMQTARAFAASDQSIINSERKEIPMPYLSSLSQAQLNVEISRLREQLATAQERVKERLEKLEDLEDQWSRAGLTHQAEFPQGKAELSEDRLTEIERIISMRHRSLKQDKANAREQLEVLREELNLTTDEWQSITSRFAKQKGQDQLLIMEEQVRMLRQRMMPLMSQLGDELAALQEDLEIPLEARVEVDCSKPNWSLSSLVAAKHQAKTLKALNQARMRALSGTHPDLEKVKKELADAQDEIERLNLALEEQTAKSTAEINDLVANVSELEAMNTDLTLEMNELVTSQDEAVEELSNDLNALEAQLKAEQQESASLKKQLMTLRLQNMSMRSLKEDFDIVSHDELKLKFPGDEQELKASISDLCKELSVSPGMAVECGLDLAWGSESSDDNTHKLRMQVACMSEHVKLRMLFASYEKLLGLQNELDMDEKARDKILGYAVEFNAMDVKAMVEYMNQQCIALNHQLTDLRAQKAQFISRCSKCLSGNKDIYEDIVMISKISCGPDVMRKVMRKTQQVEAWSRISSMDARIKKINDKLVKDMEDAEGNYDKRAAIKAKASLMRDEIYTNMQALEDQFGRMPGTMRPVNPRFFRKKHRVGKPEGFAANVTAVMNARSFLGALTKPKVGGLAQLLTAGQGNAETEGGEKKERRFSASGNLNQGSQSEATSKEHRLSLTDEPTHATADGDASATPSRKKGFSTRRGSLLKALKEDSNLTPGSPSRRGSAKI